MLLIEDCGTMFHSTLVCWRELPFVPRNFSRQNTPIDWQIKQEYTTLYFIVLGSVCAQRGHLTNVHDLLSSAKTTIEKTYPPDQNTSIWYTMMDYLFVASVVCGLSTYGSILNMVLVNPEILKTPAHVTGSFGWFVHMTIYQLKHS
jgi:hypothetical protein